METLLDILRSSPATILLAAGVLLVFLGLVRKIPIGGGITVPPDSRKRALTIGLVFVITAVIWLIAGRINGPETPTPTEEITSAIKPPPSEVITTQPPTAIQVHIDTVTPTQDPKDVVQNVVEKFFALLNDREYHEAWDYLTPGFRFRQEGGFSGFEGFWMTVKEVEISEFRSAYVPSGSDEGEIIVTLFYKTDIGESLKEYRFCLIYNELQGKWLIDYQRKLSVDC